MTLKLGVVMDPIADINYKRTARSPCCGRPEARTGSCTTWERGTCTSSRASPEPVCPAHGLPRPTKLVCAGPARGALADLDVILMRKDPPFDNGTSTAPISWKRRNAGEHLVVNRCQSLRDCNEKIFATHFSPMLPAGAGERLDPKRLRAFHRQHRDVIFKPLDGMGGTAIFRVKHDDPNISVIPGNAHQPRPPDYNGNATSGIVEGDKRILMINGEPVPYCWRGFRRWAKPAATWRRAARVEAPAPVGKGPLDCDRGRSPLREKGCCL